MPTYTMEKEYKKDQWKASDEEILDLVRERTAVSIRTVADEFGVSNPTAKKYLLVLTSEDKLEQVTIDSERGDRTYRRFTIADEE